MAKTVHIVGGGFSGLTLAYYLSRKKVPVIIYEKEHWGGCIQTIEHRGALIELAANGYLASRRFEDLNAEIGASIRGVDGPQGRYIYRDTKPRRWPLTLMESLPFLGFVLRFILQGSRLVPKSRQTVADWAKKHLSLSILQNLIEPALRGIYAGDVNRLSASLILGKFFRRAERLPPPQRKGLHTGKKGMQGWLTELMDYLSHRGVEFRQEIVTDLKPLLAGEGSVVIATAPLAAAQLLESLADRRSEILKKIEMLPVACVTLLTESPCPTQGFGCLFPATAKFAGLGVLFRQSYFPETGAPPQERWIMPWKGESEAGLIEKISQDRQRLWAEKAPTITAQHVKIWPQAMPHYTVELEEQLAQIDTLPSQIHLHGNYLGSLGLTALLERSFQLAESLTKG